MGKRNHLDSSQGDREASEEFVRETYEGLFRWFCRLTGSRDRSADLTQETYSRFWSQRGQRPAEVAPRVWLYAIGRNVWRNQARDRRIYEPVELHELPGGQRPPDLTFQDREFEAAAQRELGKLSEALREAFVLRFWQGFDYAEIAAIQGVSAGMARWRFFAARKRLHQRLADWNPYPCAKEEDHAT